MSDKKHVIGKSDEKNIGVLPTAAFPEIAPNDLQAMVRDALVANGLDSVKAVPLVQPKTLPMFEPQQPLKVSTKNALRPMQPKARAEAVETVLVPRRKKARSSAIVLTLMGVCVLASAGMAFHLARTKATFGVARAATATQVTQAKGAR